jgi:hypothetical protein
MNEGDRAVQDFQSHIRELLAPYPHSFAKSRASKFIIDAVTKSDPGRPLRFKIFDIIHGFLLLEQKRLGVERIHDPDGYALFKRQFLHDVCYWVPGKDSFRDGLRECINATAKGNSDEVTHVLHQLIEAEDSRISLEQSSRAKLPRDPKIIDTYIFGVLAKNLKISEPELWKQMEADRFGGVIYDVLLDEVQVHRRKGDHVDYYSRNAIRNRLYRLRKKM